MDASVTIPETSSKTLHEKEFMVGLHPGPAEAHVAADFNNFSVFAAEQPRSVWERHTHDCTQITVAISPASVRGEWVGANGQIERREMSGDVVWIVPPGVPHVINFDRCARLVHLYLTGSFYQQMIEAAPNDPEDSLTPALLVRDPALVELGKGLYRESLLGCFNELYVQSVATVTATHLLRTYNSRHLPQRAFRGGLGPARERRLIAYIQEHLSSPLALDVLASVAEVSPNYLISLFRQSLSMTPHKYIIQQRLERATKLLHQREMTLLEIALQCGFQDQSQFTTIFRRHCGVTPGEYRRQL